MPDESLTHRDGPPLRAVGWAAFLGASWTWCIGMYLPVLLVRDYGLWAWVVFAVPNVVGAAALAWVLRDAEASLRVMTRHLTAVAAFSLVTIAFHVFFLFSIVRPLAGSWFVLAVAVLAMLVVWLLAHHARGGWLAAAAVVLGLSTVAFVMLGLRRGLAVPGAQGQLPTVDLLWLLPVSVLGFALCPYLDVTFHRARQATGPRDGRLAFALGFGGFFLLMIVLTLLYAPLLITRSAEVRPVAATSAPPAPFIVWLVVLHMAVQAGFTVIAHARYVGRRLEAIGAETTTVLLCATIGVLIGAMILSGRVTDYRGLSGSEIAYRLFMAFYGLLFPAYVWICMVPSRAAEVAPRRAVTVFALATLVAAPMYWMGFIERRMAWLLPGAAVVVLAGVLFRWLAPRPTQISLATVPRPSDPADATKDFLTATK